MNARIQAQSQFRQLKYAATDYMLRQLGRHAYRGLAIVAGLRYRAGGLARSAAD